MKITIEQNKTETYFRGEGEAVGFVSQNGYASRGSWKYSAWARNRSGKAKQLATRANYDKAVQLVKDWMNAE